MTEIELFDLLYSSLEKVGTDAEPPLTDTERHEIYTLSFQVIGPGLRTFIDMPGLKSILEAKLKDHWTTTITMYRDSKTKYENDNTTDIRQDETQQAS